MTVVRRRSWPVRAHAAMERLIQGGEVFSADTLRDLVGDPDINGTPNARNNSIGSLFQEYSTAGRIEKVGTAMSSYPKRKGGLILLWQAKKRKALRRVKG